MVVAIDGPAGAGKSSVARAVASELGFTYLDSGAMYRAVALAALERGMDPAEVAPQVRISLGDRVLLDGNDVTETIRQPSISEAASRAAADPAVRAAMVAEQAIRDERDRTREHSPLEPAPGATVLDTTELSLDEVVARVAALVRAA